MKKFLFLLASALITLITMLLQSCSIISPITHSTVSVAFASECCGINSDGYEAMNKFLEKDKALRGFAILYFDTRWGKEGEITRCFPLVELDPFQRQNFITSLRQHLTGYRLVTVSNFCSPR